MFLVVFRTEAENHQNMRNENNYKTEKHQIRKTSKH